MGEKTTYTVAMVGEAKSGKTSIISKLMKRPFEYNYHQTIGVDIDIYIRKNTAGDI